MESFALNVDALELAVCALAGDVVIILDHKILLYLVTPGARTPESV